MEAVTTSGQAVPRLVAVGDTADRDPACLLPLAIGIDDTDTPGDMLDALALAPCVTAVADDVARAVLAQATEDAIVEQSADDGTVSMGFWYHSPRRGAYRAGRRMSAAPWTEVRANYPRAAAAALDTLVAVTPDTVPGRLVLLNGAPGTGKTTMLRTLAREWLGVPGGLAVAGVGAAAAPVGLG